MVDMLDNGHVVTDEDVDTARLIIELDRALGRPTDSLTRRVAETPAGRVRRLVADSPADPSADTNGHRIPAVEVLARTLPAYDDVVAGLPPGATAVVVTHGAALKVTVLALLGWPQDHTLQLQGLDNCGAAVVEQDGIGAAWRLVAWNLRPDFVPDEPAG